MVIRPRCSLSALEPTLLLYPLRVLNLTVRASNCLSHVPTISALLSYPESELMRQRHFGRTSLADLRRKMVHFCIDHLGVEAAHPIRSALYDPHPAVVAVWHAPPQPRPLGEVVDELLELLSRPEELRAAGTWSYSATTIGPPRPIRLDDASLAEVIDSFFQPLRARERRMVEMRFGALDSAGATLAEIGADFGVTRERVRQILQACLQRLATESERHRRRQLTQFLTETVERAGGLIREEDLAGALRARLRRPHPESGPFLRAFLSAEPHYLPAGPGVWASRAVSLEAVAGLRAQFRAALRKAGRPLHRSELLAVGRDGGHSGEAFILSCLRTDDRLCSRDGERYGLAEWEWLLPRTLADYVYLALRSAGRPRHYLWITEYVNSLLPEGSECSAREVHATLLDRQDWFTRVREGTYGLAEGALVSRAGRPELAARDRPGSGDGSGHGKDAWRGDHESRAVSPRALHPEMGRHSATPRVGTPDVKLRPPGARGPQPQTGCQARGRSAPPRRVPG